jgi:hypothetical protein
MSSSGRILSAIVAIAALGAFGIIVFNINWRGHYVYCGPEGCLSFEAISRFALPFAFLFAKHLVVLFGLWFAIVIVRQLMRNLSTRRMVPVKRTGLEQIGPQ